MQWDNCILTAQKKMIMLDVQNCTRLHCQETHVYLILEFFQKSVMGWVEQTILFLRVFFYKIFAANANHANSTHIVHSS